MALKNISSRVFVWAVLSSSIRRPAELEQLLQAWRRDVLVLLRSEVHHDPEEHFSTNTLKLQLWKG